MRDTVLEARSIELRPDALSDIGARKTFEPRELLQLADLLWDRDTPGVLAALLIETRRVGHLGPLRDLDRVPDDWEPVARELADLLGR